MLFLLKGGRGGVGRQTTLLAIIEILWPVISTSRRIPGRAGCRPVSLSYRQHSKMPQLPLDGAQVGLDFPPLSTTLNCPFVNIIIILSVKLR